MCGGAADPAFLPAPESGSAPLDGGGEEDHPAPSTDTDSQTASSGSREDRFPSVEERLKLYMSNWYAPPCPGYHDGFVRYEFARDEKKAKWPTLMVHPMKNHPLVNETRVLPVDSVITPDKLLYLDEDTVENCADLELFEFLKDGGKIKSKRKEALTKRSKHTFQVTLRATGQPRGRSNL